jgi:hypothetical protein
MAWYNWSLRPLINTSATAGRNDLMSAAYFPYCDQFISDDWGLEKDLGEVVVEAGLERKILAFADFENSMILAV